MSCTGGGTPAPAGYVWTGGFAAGTTAAVASGTLTQTTTFTATASNAGGVSNVASKSVTVSTGGGGSINCNMPNGGTTHVIDMPWGATSIALTIDSGGFGPNDAVVVRFTTSNWTSATGKGYVRAVEFADPMAPRTGALSATACDFGPGLPKVGGGSAAFANDTAPWIYFSLFNLKTGTPTLSNGTQYFFNMKNASCPSGSCNMQIYLVKPTGS